MQSPSTFSLGRGVRPLNEAWLHLLVLAQLRLPCKLDTNMVVSSTSFQMQSLLRSLNVYIEPGKENDEFYVEIMKFIQRFVQFKYAGNIRVPLFFGEFAGTQADQALERIVEYHIITWGQKVRHGRH